MSDTGDAIKRAIDQARREGYAAGVRAAAEVAETVMWVPHRPTRSDTQIKEITSHWGAQIAAAIRALDGKGDGV